MFEFTGLRILHQDMKNNGKTRAVFPFDFNKKSFSCIFMVDIFPFRLYLTTVGINPIDGPIYCRQGMAGEAFIVTESRDRTASCIYVTRSSAGITRRARINNLALPGSNKAEIQDVVYLSRNQILLEGRVAAQHRWATDGIPRNGGGWQVVTDGGVRSGAVIRR